MGKAFLFKCPATGLSVQGYDEEDGLPANGQNRYTLIECLACRGLHLINPETGKLLSDDSGPGVP
jgi:hypothetical protein